MRNEYLPAHKSLMIDKNRIILTERMDWIDYLDNWEHQKAYRMLDKMINGI